MKNDEIAEDAPQGVSLDTNDDDMYIDPVQFESEEDLENPVLAMKKLREKLKTCEKEKKEYLD